MLSFPKDLKNLTGKPSEPVRLPANPRPALREPSGYEPDDELVDALRVALFLRKPLLVTGEPGTGKTDLGHYLAWKMAKIPCYQFEAKSTSKANDLFYTYDSLRRFEMGSTVRDARDFLQFAAMGKAILNSNRTLPADLSNISPRVFEHQGPTQSVVVIDEIDKAPRDFPNDVLNEIDRNFFNIPELGIHGIEADPEFAPVVIITSNEERTLPAPFLRRCAFYHIAFPEDREKRHELLRRIVEKRVPELSEDTSPLAKDAVDLFDCLRESGRLDRKPATGELLDWVLALLKSGADPAQGLRDKSDAFLFATLSALIKNKDDREPAQKAVSEWKQGSAKD